MDQAFSKEQIEKMRSVDIRKAFFHLNATRRVVCVVCPFHKDRSPSLALYDNNTFHCFGCKAHGRGAIDFVMKLGADFKTACEEVQKLI